MIELIIIIGLLFVIWVLLLIVGRLYYKLNHQPKTLEEMRYKILKRKLP